MLQILAQYATTMTETVTSMLSTVRVKIVEQSHYIQDYAGIVISLLALIVSVVVGVITYRSWRSGGAIIGMEAQIRQPPLGIKVRVTISNHGRLEAFYGTIYIHYLGQVTRLKMEPLSTNVGENKGILEQKSLKPGISIYEEIELNELAMLATPKDTLSAFSFRTIANNKVKECQISSEEIQEYHDKFINLVQFNEEKIRRKEIPSFLKDFLRDGPLDNYSDN